MFKKNISYMYFKKLGLYLKNAETNEEKELFNDLVVEDFNKGCKRNKKFDKEIYIYIEFYLSGKWLLFDPVLDIIINDYNYNNLIMPNKSQVYRKSINNMSFGCFSKEDNDSIIKQIVK